LNREKNERMQEGLDVSDLDEMQDMPDQEDPSGRRGTMVGSGYYVSPEMLEREESSAQTDLWQLGCIIFYMIVGRVPFPYTANCYEMIMGGQI
jgi:serine/threonine protein kinase